MALILVVDDDELIRELLADSVTRNGHEVRVAGTLAQARQVLQTEEPDLVYLDVRLPDGSGIEALEEVRAAQCAPEVIIITGQGDPDGAELALRCGAWDYIEKPSSVDRMVLPLFRALAYRAEKRKRKTVVLPGSTGIVGASPKLAACLSQAAISAASTVDVFITGETGTGKELFAQAIHAGSGRSRGPFVVVDCTTLPANLAESELFGHERGSFTGADRRQVGLIEQADGGTLFLDEVGELPLPLQAKFLRVLQERRFRPVGGTMEKTSDFRLVAATNRDLAAMSRRGEFRDDLLYRLKAFTIALPPLREREGDIHILLQAHLARAAAKTGQQPPSVAPEFLELLEAHDWPGNVRELLQTLDMSLVSAHGELELLPQHLPLDLRVRLVRHRVGGKIGLAAQETGSPARSTTEAGAQMARPAAPLPPWRDYRARAMEGIEAVYFAELLRQCGGDVALAALTAGLKPARLYELLGKHGLGRTRRPFGE